SSWRRTDGQDATREHLLMALSDIDVLMVRASYAERMIESRISNIHMDIAVPHATGLQQAVEVEQCTCPVGYSGPSCQDCDIGYTRSTSGLYLGTCERCQCGGHSSECDGESGECLNCQHNTEGAKCERCKPGFYGAPRPGSPAQCQPCPCRGTSGQYFGTCFLDTDGQPTCDSCPTGSIGRQCERCAPGYRGDPTRGQPCTPTPGPSTGCQCDLRGSVNTTCDSHRQCPCKPHVEGLSCSTCRPSHFYLSADHPDGCLPCFCMGVTQQCSSSSYHRELVTSPFLPGNFQNFALVNRQHNVRITSGFVVEMSVQGPQLSYRQFDQLGQESFYWQLPENYQGDKREMFFARMRRAHKITILYVQQNESSLTEEEMRRRVAAGDLEESHDLQHRFRRQAQYSLVYKGFSLFPEGVFYWSLPKLFLGDKVTSYGGTLRYTLTYTSGIRGSPLPDADVQITGNDITLVAYQTEVRPRETKTFEIAFREVRDTAPSICFSIGPLSALSASTECDLHDRTVPRATLAPEEACTSDTANPVIVVDTRKRVTQRLVSARTVYIIRSGSYVTSVLLASMGMPLREPPEDCQLCACPLSDPERTSFLRPVSRMVLEANRCTACPIGYTGQYCERSVLRWILVCLSSCVHRVG
ncbi:unnamed protein product, partial [Ranitomeya imitator]